MGVRVGEEEGMGGRLLSNIFDWGEPEGGLCEAADGAQSLDEALEHRTGGGGGSKRLLRVDGVGSKSGRRVGGERQEKGTGQDDEGRAGIYTRTRIFDAETVRLCAFARRRPFVSENEGRETSEAEEG